MFRLFNFKLRYLIYILTDRLFIAGQCDLVKTGQPTKEQMNRGKVVVK